MNPFDVVLIQPFLNILILFYKILSQIGIPGALGLSIIFLTVAIRLALWPLTATQLKSTQKLSALRPHLERIKKEHGTDKIRHQQEVSALYKKHGVNPMAGCLPLILQIPVFIALYQVLLKIVNIGNGDFMSSINSQLYFPWLHLNTLPATNFLSFDLATKPNQWTQAGFLILLIPIVTGVLQFIQSKMLAPTSSASRPERTSLSAGEARRADGLQTKDTNAKAIKRDDDKKESMEDTMASMQSQMTLIMPAMIAFFSYGFPVGLSLYWNTFTVIGIIQQYKISGAGPLNKYLPKKWQKKND